MCIRDRFPHEPKYCNELAWAWREEGGRLSGIRAEDAEKAYRQALLIEERQVAESPTVPDYQFVVGVCYCDLGILLRNTSRLEDAEKAFRIAIETLEKLIADFPNLRPSTHGGFLSTSYDNLFDLLKSAGRDQDAENIARQAIDHYEKLAAAHASEPEIRSILA